jgi:peptide/nickel transport system permease protein
MTRHLLHRLGQSALVLLVMSFLIYMLIGLMPGDPVDLMIATMPDLTPADAARLKAIYGLDRPLHERYLAWLAAAAQGDLGYSRTYAQPVMAVMAVPLGNTVILMSASLVVALLIALPLGTVAALRPNGWIDGFVNLTAFAGISMPTFWLGLMLIVLFAVQLGALPAGGVATIGGGGLLDRLEHLMLPVATLSVASAGAYVRHVRASMLQTLRQDWIRTARAKGAGWGRIVVHHAMRNALVPVVTILALDLGSLFSGALITETVFAYPGMGKLIYDAVMSNDFNLALTGLLMATLLTLAGNLLADLAYAALDPRISYR